MVANITIGKLTEQLQRVAAADPDAVVRINGEYLNALTVTLQNPISTVVRNEAIAHREQDKSRSRVVDISANGREPEPLPENHIDLRHW